MTNNRNTGKVYEEKACQYLMDKGYKIIANNYHAGKTGEIDIIAVHDRTLVFIEVKYRKNNNSGNPLEAVSYKKMIQICKVATVYIAKNGINADQSVRFDVIGIDGQDNITHIENAFDYINPYEKIYR